MEKWINFYIPYFTNEDEARNFVECCENESGPTSAKLIMHQTQRLISLSNEVAILRPGQDGLQLLFLIVCAETVAKLAYNYNGEGKSKEYVTKFFSDFVNDVDKTRITHGFVGFKNEQFPFETIIDKLYRIRCEVVHEGRYWGFSFSENGNPTYNAIPPFIVRIQIQELRDIIVIGSIHAAAISLITPLL
jgi:hypothetical protein